MRKRVIWLSTVYEAALQEPRGNSNRILILKIPPNLGERSPWLHVSLYCTTLFLTLCWKHGLSHLSSLLHLPLLLKPHSNQTATPQYSTENVLVNISKNNNLIQFSKQHSTQLLTFCNVLVLLLRGHTPSFLLCHSHLLFALHLSLQLLGPLLSPYMFSFSPLASI